MTRSGSAPPSAPKRPPVFRNQVTVHIGARARDPERLLSLEPTIDSALRRACVGHVNANEFGDQEFVCLLGTRFLKVRELKYLVTGASCHDRVGIRAQVVCI